jgi:hypothetical protein
MVLGRNEMVNQIFHRELGTLLGAGPTSAGPDGRGSAP